MTTLIVYVGVLAHSAYRLRDVSNYASVVLVGILLIRTLTETPMDDMDLLHLATLTLLLSWEHERNQSAMTLPRLPVNRIARQPRFEAR